MVEKNGRNRTLLVCLKNQYNKKETFIFKKVPKFVKNQSANAP